MGLVRVVNSGTLYGQLVQNVLHFNNPNDVLTLQAIANLIDGSWLSKITLRQQSDLVWTNILVTSLGDVQTAPFSLVIQRQGQSFSSKSIPSFAAFVLRLSTNRFGRQGRGRVFIPGVNFNSCENGLFTPAEVTQWETNVLPTIRQQFLEANNATLPMVVHHKGGGSDDVTAIQLRNVVGCQRRRMPGVGA